MATITTTAPGNWNATGTWVGGVVPGIADTAKLLHQVTLTASTNVGGIDPASTAALIATSGSFRIIVGSTGYLYIVNPLVF